MAEFVKFEAENGTEIYINPELVAFVCQSSERSPNSKVCHPTGISEVKGTPAEVVAALTGSAIERLARAHTEEK